jgi:hypothetical protein
MDNTGRDLDASAPGGVLALRDATVKGGRLSATGGSRLVIGEAGTSAGAILDGVTLATAPQFGDERGGITVYGGIALEGVTIDLSGGPGNPGNTLMFGDLRSQEQAIGGSGRIWLGSGTNRGAGLVSWRA